MNIVTNDGQTVKHSYLAEFSERDGKWDYHRSHGQDIASLYNAKPAKFGKYGDRMNTCASLLAFGWSLPDEHGETRLKLRTAMFCKVRHCPVCSWRRAMRNVARFFQKMPDLKAAYPKHRWLFLTLTVKNCELDDLRTTIQHMNKSWQRLIQRQDWPADGWVRTVEVTRAKDGKAHPHFHVMLMVPPSYFGVNYVKQEEWTARWKDAARLDYDPVIDIRVIKPKVEGQDLQAAVVETLKYGTKVEDSLTNATWLYGITDQLHKSRFLASGGALAGILKEDLTNAEMIQGEDATDEADQDKPGVIFKWQRPERKYRKQG